MSFVVEFAPTAREDFHRLYGFLLERAQYAEELETAERALLAIETAVRVHLSQTPMIYRKAGDGKNSLRRELLIPFGAGGYVALYEVILPARILVLAVRHQAEEDYH